MTGPLRALVLRSAADMERREGGWIASGEGFARGFVDFVDLVLPLGRGRLLGLSLGGVSLWCGGLADQVGSGVGAAANCRAQHQGFSVMGNRGTGGRQVHYVPPLRTERPSGARCPAAKPVSHSSPLKVRGSSGLGRRWRGTLGLGLAAEAVAEGLGGVFEISQGLAGLGS
jgi:hypothetical protein